MANGRISAFIAGERPNLLWIEFGAYARRVFAASAAAWNASASAQAGAIAQAHRVIPSDVVSVDLTAPFLSARRAGDDVPTVLAGEAPRLFAFDLIDAVAHTLAGRADIVVRVPAPADLCRAAGRGGEPNFDAMDEAMMAVADLLRAASSKPISALLIATEARRALSEDEVEALETLCASARYYNWPVALAADASAGRPEAATLLLDAESDAMGRACGGGLGERFWQGGAAAPAAGLLFGQIPEAARPETVLAAVSGLVKKNAG
jgi:hypothetical protein